MPVWIAISFSFINAFKSSIHLIVGKIWETMDFKVGNHYPVLLMFLKIPKNSTVHNPTPLSQPPSSNTQIVL